MKYLLQSGKKAWQVIEKTGLRGYSSGDAVFSKKHANWIVNKGKATASDIIRLIRTAQRRARKQMNVKLELEVRYI